MPQSKPVSSGGGGARSNGRELSELAPYFESPDVFARGNNSNFFWPYDSQKAPEDIYRFLGTVDVSELSALAQTIPEVRACVRTYVVVSAALPACLTDCVDLFQRTISVL